MLIGADFSIKCHILMIDLVVSFGLFIFMLGSSLLKGCEGNCRPGEK